MKKFISTFGFLFTLFLFTSTSYAQTFGQLDIIGNVEVALKGRKLSSKVAQLANVGSSNAISGSIELGIWVTRSKYSGQSSIAGYKVYNCNYQGLQGGFAYYNLNCGGNMKRTVPSGNYYVTIVASEFNGSEYLIEDWHTFSKKFKF